MNKIRITKTEEPLCRSGFVLNFEHSNFDIVSDFGFRYSDLGRDLCLSETGHISEIECITFETLYYLAFFNIVLYVIDNIIRPGSRSEDLGYAALLKGRNILFRNNAATKDQYILHPLLP